MVEVVYLVDSALMHKPGFEHPENSVRALRVIESTKRVAPSYREVRAAGIDQREVLKLATRVHARGYVEYLVRMSQKAPVLVDEDTYIVEDSLTLALSAFYYSYELALRSGSTPVFAVVRPPGHHVGKGGKAMGASTQGFCLLNNVASAVLGLLDRGYKRVAVIDFDAHHGNGTMEIFYEDRILQVDFHQDPETLYPHTGYPEEIGRGEGYGYKVNIVLPPHGADDLFTVLVDKVSRLLQMFNPEAVAVSAGFDAYTNDGLADLMLTEASYYSIGRALRELSVPTIAVLEGGYGIGLERGSQAFLEGLAGVEKNYKVQTKTPPALYRKTLDVAEKVVSRAMGRLG